MRLLPRIARYKTIDNQQHWGLVLNGDRIHRLPKSYTSTQDLMRDWHALCSASAATDGMTHMLHEVQLLSPITTDQQLICQGLNYREHLQESGIDPGSITFNTIFTKASSSLTGARAKVVRPSHVKLLDYEAEIGLVLKRALTQATEITASNWHEWVGGLVLCNDLSARDIQLPQIQFYKGKSYRGFAPTGPWIQLVDNVNIKRFEQLGVQLAVNGQVRQDFKAADMLFKPWQTLTELSAIQDLNAGDMVITGTSCGVAARAPGALTMFIAKHFISEKKRWQIFVRKGLNNPLYLKDGDRVEIKGSTPGEVLDLGTQSVEIAAPI
jgi:2-keto-4-pentenoate hydratase/2-oxohepta-3-ene-1,7-dioic acid hydratase in catechol pathway